MDQLVEPQIGIVSDKSFQLVFSVSDVVNGHVLSSLVFQRVSLIHPDLEPDGGEESHQCEHQQGQEQEEYDAVTSAGLGISNIKVLSYCQT